MRLAGVSVSADSVAELASIVRATGGGKLADRLERALTDNVKLLALSIDAGAIILDALEAPPGGLDALRGSALRGDVPAKGDGWQPAKSVGAQGGGK